MKNQIGLSKSMLVALTLEQEILSGKMTKGEQLASESALVKRFSVSRNTVRKGLDQLTNRGLITKSSGIGSFVMYSGEVIDSDLGWTQALLKTEDEVKTKIISINRASCNNSLKYLKLETDDFLCVDRLRYLSEGKVGISLERSRSPWREEFSLVLEKGLIHHSLNNTMSEAGLIADHGEEWVEVLPELSQTDADIMGRKAGEPMLQLHRVTRTSSGEAVEYVDSILDPSRFTLHLNF